MSGLKSIYQKLTLLFASGLFTGYSKTAPGTIGSISFWLLWILYALYYSTPGLSQSIFISLFLTVVGYISTLQVMRTIPEKDPQFIVIDEWIGLSITFIAMHGAENPLVLSVVALILFRIFDITKLWPISAFENLPGAVGVLADDIVAGLFAGGTLLLVQQRLPIL